MLMNRPSKWRLRHIRWYVTMRHFRRSSSPPPPPPPLVALRWVTITIHLFCVCGRALLFLKDVVWTTLDAHFRSHGMFHRHKTNIETSLKQTRRRASVPNVLSRDRMRPMDGVWIGNRIYWPPTTTVNPNAIAVSYTLQFITTRNLLSLPCLH
jgi:hypothetical protein